MAWESGRENGTELPAQRSRSHFLHRGFSGCLKMLPNFRHSEKLHSVHFCLPLEGASSLALCNRHLEIDHCLSVCAEVQPSVWVAGVGCSPQMYKLERDYENSKGKNKE